MIAAIASTALATDLPEDHTQWPAPVFRSAYKLIASGEEWTTLDTLSGHELGTYLEYFWKRRDPTPTTPDNEFREQFRERVAVACTRYAQVPNPDPWDPRGETYIKLGPPDQIEDEINYYAPMDTAKYRRGMPVFEEAFSHLGEAWFYFSQNLQLQFQEEGASMALVPYVKPSGEYTEFGDFAEDVAKVKESDVVYHLPVGQQELHALVDWYAFRRQDGRYDLYLNCALSAKAFAEQTGYREYELDYKARTVLFDSTLQPVWSDSAYHRHQIKGRAKGLLAQRVWHTTADPGLYVAALEVTNEEAKKHASATREGRLVPYVESADLDLSPLVIAEAIRPIDSLSSGIVRNGKEIVPMPGHGFRKGETIAFYHEVYNLQADTGGRYVYQLDYSLYDRKRQERREIFSEVLASEQADVFQAGTIPGDQLKKGDYILEARTTDLVTGAEKTALAALYVR